LSLVPRKKSILISGVSQPRILDTNLYAFGLKSIDLAMPSAELPECSIIFSSIHFFQEENLIKLSALSPVRKDLGQGGRIGGGDSKVGEAPLRSLFPLVAMVQPTDPGQFNHLATFRWLRLERTFTGSVFLKAIMGPVVVVIVKIGRKDSL